MLRVSCRDKAKEDLKDFIDWYKKILGDKVEKIVISNRLTTSPTAIVTGTYGYTANMERLMKAQALNDPSRYNFMASKKTLEINPYHPIIVELAKKSKDNADDDATKELAFVLYDSSLITAGFDIDDQASFSTRMMKMLRKGLDIGDEAKVEEESEDEDTPEDDKEDADKDSDKKESKEEL